MEIYINMKANCPYCTKQNFLIEDITINGVVYQALVCNACNKIISILNNSLISEFSVNMNKRFEELSERINSLHDEKNEKIAQEVSRMKDLM